MDFGKIFDETMRKVLWFVGRFALQILDFAYKTLLSIFKLNVGDFPFIWDWFKGISILLFFFVLIRLCLMYFKTFYDDEEIERLSGIGILRRLMTIGIIMVKIQVEALDRPHLLSDVTRVLSDHGVNIISGSISTGTDRVATSQFSFEMADPQHLNTLLAAVRKIEGVFDVYRITGAKDSAEPRLRKM